MKVLNKNGKLNKIYLRKIWNHVTQTNVDCFNGEINDKEMLRRFEEFTKLIDTILIYNEKFDWR